MLLMTSNPDYIRQWATQRGGHPTKPLSQGWPGISFVDDDDNSEAISWEEFFRLFADFHLGLAYDPTPASRHYAMMAVADETEEEPEQPAPKTTHEDLPGEEDETFRAHAGMSRPR